MKHRRRRGRHSRTKDHTIPQPITHQKQHNATKERARKTPRWSRAQRRVRKTQPATTVANSFTATVNETSIVKCDEDETDWGLHEISQSDADEPFTTADEASNVDIDNDEIFRKTHWHYDIEIDAENLSSPVALRKTIDQIESRT